LQFCRYKNVESQVKVFATLTDTQWNNSTACKFLGPVFLLGLMWGFPTVYRLHPKMFLYRCQLRILCYAVVAFSFNYDSVRSALRLSSQDRCSTTASPFSQHVHVSCCLLYNNHNVGVAPGLLNLCSVQR